MYKKFTTNSGLRVILSPLQETETIALQVLCTAGSRHENEINNGISHFIEHMMFKGTTKRPTALEITKEMDSVGAILNAYTSKDHTNYHVKMAADKIEMAFDLLSDMIFNSKFDPNEIEKEKGVILEELNMREDDPETRVDTIFEKLVYQDHKLGWDIIGTRETINQMTKQMFTDYLAELYNPKNMVLSLAGKFTESQAEELINKYFNFQPSDKKTEIKRFESTQVAPRISVIKKETEQAAVEIGFPAYGQDHEKIMPFYVLATILGGNMSSRLFMKIREEQGLCYTIRAVPDMYQDAGSLVIRTGLDKNRIKTAIELIIKETDKIKNEKITEDELKRAQDFLAGRIVLQMEDSENIASYYGRQEMLTGKIMDIKERIEKLKQVTIEDVAQVANEIIKKEKINLSIVGPFDDPKMFEEIVKGW